MKQIHLMKMFILAIFLLLATGCAVYTPAPYYYGRPYPYYYRHPYYGYHRNYGYGYHPYYGYKYYGY